MGRIKLVLFLIAVSFSVLPGVVSAQVRTPLTSSTAFPVSVVSPDNALATEINPSALGALDSWSLAVSHVSPARETAYSDRQTSVFLASKLGEGFALGTGIDVFRSERAGLASYNGFVLGTAFNAGPAWSLGTNWRLRSPRPGGANAHTADVGLTFRPSTTLGFSVLGRDLAFEQPYLGASRLRRSAVLATAVRPLGDDRLGLELAGVIDQAEDLGVRIAASVKVPWVGRLAAAGELQQLNGQEVWTLSAGIDVRLGGLSVAPAIHTNHQGDDIGWSILADMHGTPRIGVPAQRYVAKIRLNGLGTRGLPRTIMALDRALHDPRVAGVILEPRDTSAGLAVAQEMRLMIAALQKAGKPVYCHLESPSGSEYYLCSGADRVSLDPAGAIRLMGVSSDALYFGDVLRNIGVRADFVRIGRYKSAPEQFTNRTPSDFASQQRDTLLDDAYSRLVHDLSGDLERDEAAVRTLIDSGPFTASEAVQSKLVTGTLDTHDLTDAARDLFGAHMPVVNQSETAEDPRFGPTGQIGVVVIDGTIVDGENVDVPFLDIHMSGGRTIVKSIDELAENPRIRAIVLRIDSPGGAVTASDQIWRAVKRARKKKPVIASMGNVAASGGYYVAAPATEIWASPSTITGSIGIFYGKVDIAPLAERLGVGITTAQRGAHAGADSMFRPFSDEERASLATKLRIWYRQFVERVAEGRKMPVEQVDTLARGHVYSGDAALANGLVDSLGGFGSALARARELGKLGPNAQVVTVPKRPSTLLDFVTGVSASASLQLPISAALKPLLSRLVLLSMLSGSEPVALFEGPGLLQ